MGVTGKHWIIAMTGAIVVLLALWDSPEYPPTRQRRDASGRAGWLRRGRHYR